MALEVIGWQGQLLLNRLAHPLDGQILQVASLEEGGDDIAKGAVDAAIRRYGRRVLRVGHGRQQPQDEACREGAERNAIVVKQCAQGCDAVSRAREGGGSMVRWRVGASATMDQCAGTTEVCVGVL